MARGLSVIQGDADHDLADYPDGAFDYAILCLTIQATRQPQAVLEHLLRIGRHAIVSFPNFGHWRIRTQLLLDGPHAGDREPARCLVSVAQRRTCARSRISPTSAIWSIARVERKVAFNVWGQQLGTWIPLTAHNLLGEKAVFMLTRAAGR